MSKSDFTSTISVSVVSAAVVVKGQKKSEIRSFSFPGSLSQDEAEKAVEKAGKKAGFRLVYVDAVNVSEKLYELPIEKFTANAKKLSRRGEDGRTREPVITRTLELSVISAAVVVKGQKKSEIRSFSFPGSMSDEEAEKAVEKAGKKAGFRLVYVDSVTVDSAVYEMRVIDFVKLCEEAERDTKKPEKKYGENQSDTE